MSAATEQISVLVLGIGNLVMSDDAVGILAVQRLNELYRFPESVEIMDGGTLGLDLLPKLENLSHLIMIDAVETGQEPGTCVILRGDELPIALQTKVSPHQMGLKDLLAVSELMGHMPQEMVLVGVQPGSIEMEVGLTSAVEAQLEGLCATVLSELNKWGITAEVK